MLTPGAVTQKATITWTNNSSNQTTITITGAFTTNIAGATPPIPAAVSFTRLGFSPGGWASHSPGTAEVIVGDATTIELNVLIEALITPQVIASEGQVTGTVSGNSGVGSASASKTNIPIEPDIEEEEHASGN